MSCEGTTSSATESKIIRIKPLVVEVSMTLGGTLSSKDIASSPLLQQQLVNGVADALGVQKALVQLADYKDGRRRLLAVSVTFRVLASSATNAAALQSKAATADFQRSINQAGANVKVSGVNAFFANQPPAAVAAVTVAAPSQASPVPNVETLTGKKDNNMNSTTLMAAVVGSVGGVLVIVGAIVFSICIRRRSSAQRTKTSALLQNRYAAPTCPSPYQTNGMHPPAHQANGGQSCVQGSAQQQVCCSHSHGTRERYTIVKEHCHVQVCYSQDNCHVGFVPVTSFYLVQKATC